MGTGWLAYCFNERKMCSDIFITSAEKRQVGVLSFAKEAISNPVLRGALGEVKHSG